MKKICVILVVLLVVCSLVACRHASTPDADPIELGRAAFAQLAEPAAVSRVVSRVDLPEGIEFVADWGDLGVMVAEVLDPDVHAVLYGVYRDGDYVLPCQYKQLERIGNYYFAHYYNLDDQKIEVYDRKGNLLVWSTDADAAMMALTDDYFVFYNQENAQLFDCEGNAYFGDGILSATDGVSICGDYVLTVSADSSRALIWDGYNVLRHRFVAPATRYTVAYVGGRFLVTALTEGSASDYTYKEQGEGTLYYVKQQAWWYDPVGDVLTDLDLDYVLLSVKNAYSVGMTAMDVANMHLTADHSAAVVAEIAADKTHVADRYYVLDANAERVVRYPLDINPTAIYYRSDRGCIGSAMVNGAAALFDLAGNLIWQNKEHAYAAMRWQSGRLVAAYHEDGKTYYGAFDSEGEVAVPFVYDYLSPYVDGKCVGHIGDAYYVLDGAGNPLTSITIACPQHWLGYGVYTVREGEVLGVAALDGTMVVAPQWQEFSAIGYNADGTLYMVAREGNRQTVLRLQ